MKSEFIICLNCADGRTQEPAIAWAKRRGYKWADMVTEPGMDGLLADRSADIAPILDRARRLIEVHGCDEVAVCGHTDCAGNPADDATHIATIRDGVDRVAEELPGLSVIGVWIGPDWQARELLP